MRSPARLLILPALVACTGVEGEDSAAAPAWSARVLASGLENMFEVVGGPDGYLWVTQRSTGSVLRVSTVDGSTSVLVTIPDVVYTSGGPQDGLLGMALHADLADGELGDGELGNPYVFVAYTYDIGTVEETPDRRVRIARYTYDADTDTLSAPLTVLEGLPGSSDHNAGRLLYGSDGMLWYAIGDQGANQYEHYCDLNLALTLPTAEQVEAKDWSAYPGKVLRLAVDGSIPADNPVLAGVRSHVWSFGHRNPQGLVFAEDGTLYSAEHGPKSDDELNVIVPGASYGWPRIAGNQDDLAYVYAEWASSEGIACADLIYDDYAIPASVPVSRESDWAEPNEPPLQTFYTVADDYDFEHTACAASGLDYLCWPTLAPSSVAAYPGSAVAELEGELLLTSLKYGTLYRTTGGGTGIEAMYSSQDRYRRVTVDPTGRKIYVATDATGSVAGPGGEPSDELDDPGSILELSTGG